MLFVPIFNVVSTAPGDILDTIECFSHGFSVVRMWQRLTGIFMFFTQMHLVNESKIYVFTPAVAKSMVLLVFCLSTGRIRASTKL